VLPKLFEWPPARSIIHLVDRVSLLLLVGGAVFELVTGVMNIQYFYACRSGFTRRITTYYGACVFIAAFVVHMAFRLRRMVTALRSRACAASCARLAWTPRSTLAGLRPIPKSHVPLSAWYREAPVRPGSRP
jgi:hypothetical protein